MKDSIKLHPEHGLNPTLCVCFFCNQETGELALLGASYDGQAPMHMVTSYEPCEKCQGIMDQGITVMETTDKPNSPKQPPFHDKYPTGRWAVASDQFANGIIDETLRANILKARRALVSVTLFDMICAQAEKQELLESEPQGNA